jgi:steroid 5-alpha reductase family enzyme
MEEIKIKFIDMILKSGNLCQKKEFNFYCKVDQDTSGLILSFLCSLLCYLLSKITGNYSWVDRFWSIVPTLYILHFSIYRNICENLDFSERQILIFFLSSLWSIRLTYNFFRKGGYNPGGEDYRWQIVKKTINNSFLWELMNIFFISLFQNVLLYLIATPASLANKTNLNKIDYIIAFVYLLFLAIESISDQQQWNFQEKKKLLKNENKELTGDFKRGFLTKGLFKYSRHPNFFAEMALWCTIYAFSVNASGIYLNWTIIGTIILTLLFQASTLLTEKISISKYNEYKIYQKTTSRFMLLPSFFEEEEKEKEKNK